jgi:hypothetical protein
MAKVAIVMFGWDIAMVISLKDLKLNILNTSQNLGAVKKKPP